MEEDSRRRLYALDGLRGLAILLVFLNHINPSYLVSAFPVLDWLGTFSSGVTGVSFLFVLSGFLMAYLHPRPKSSLGFLQKRYERIFPLFLTMNLVVLIEFSFPNLAWYQSLGVILLLALCTHVLWVYGIRKLQLSKVFFLFFLLLQISVGIFYAFWIMRHPPLFFSELSQAVRIGIIGLVNATLTFPLGNYIPMLDGVYWSLASEILFYILYPFILVPLLLFLVTKTRNIKVFFLFSFLPFLGGVDILSHHLFVLSTLQFSLFYYFATGIGLAYIFTNHQQIFLSFSKYFYGWRAFLSLSVFLFLIVVQHLFNNVTASWLSPWVRLIMAFPFTIVIASALCKNSPLEKFLSSKTLVFFGTISYSMYLSHSVIITVVEEFFKQTNLFTNICFIIASFALSTAIAYLLYVFLERPYFFRSSIQKSQQSFVLRTPSKTKAKFILGGIVIIYIVAVFLAFQSRYNFFSLVIPVPNTVFISPQIPSSQKIISLLSYPNVTMKVNSIENNFGIIAISVQHLKQKNTKVESPMLRFSIRDENTNRKLFATAYVLDEFRGVDFPFGFPAITNSKGKNYLIDLSLTSQTKEDYATIDTHSVESIYQLNKSQIFTNPARFVSLFESKMQNIYADKLSFITLLFLLPLIIISAVLIVS